MESKDLLKCAYCEQRFSKRDHRKRHERSHTNTKPYACHLCGRRYARSDVLLRHVRLHSEKDNILPPSSQRSSHPRQNSAGELESEPTEEHGREPLEEPSFDTQGTDPFHAYSHEQLPTESPFAPHGHFPPHHTHYSAAAGSSHFPFEHHQPDDPTALRPNGRIEHDPNRDEDAYGVELLRTLGQPQHRGHPGGPPPPPEYHHPAHPPSHPHDPHHNRFALHHPQVSPSPDALAQQQQQSTPQFTFPNESSLSEANQRFPRHLGQPHYPHYPPPFSNAAPHLQETENSNEDRPPPTDPALFWPPPPEQQKHPPASSLLDLSSLFRRNSQGDHRKGTSSDVVSSLWLTRTAPEDHFAMARRPLNASATANPANRHLNHNAAARVWRRLETGSLPFGATMPSLALLNELIDLYFEYWHPFWPILHSPTFDGSSASSLLLLGICSLGALFLDTPDRFNFSLAVSNKLLEHISSVMSPTLCPTLDKFDSDMLQIFQASMLRQLYGLASGERKSLQSGHLFHASPANLAREGGLLTPSKQQVEINGNDEEIEVQWREWAYNESRKRTAFAFLLNDLYFSQLFISSPHFTAGSISFPLPSSEGPFQAPNARAWADSMKTAPVPMTPYYELALNLFTDRLPVFLKPAQLTPFGLQTLIGSIFAVVLSTRFGRRYLDHDIAASPAAVMPLANALTSALAALPPAESDAMGAGILWNAAWVHLLVDMKAAEHACGREGPSQRNYSMKHFREWVSSPRARRALLHAMDVQLRVKQLSSRKATEVDLHVLTCLFHSWIVFRIYLTLSNAPSGIQIPCGPVDWKGLGNVGLVEKSQPSRTYPDITDLSTWIETGRLPKGRFPFSGKESGGIGTRGNSGGPSKLKAINALSLMKDMIAQMPKTSVYPLKNSLAELMEAIDSNDALLGERTSR